MELAALCLSALAFLLSLATYRSSKEHNEALWEEFIDHLEDDHGIRTTRRKTQ